MSLASFIEPIRSFVVWTARFALVDCMSGMRVMSGTILHGFHLSSVPYRSLAHVSARLIHTTQLVPMLFGPMYGIFSPFSLLLAACGEEMEAIGDFLKKILPE